MADKAPKTEKATPAPADASAPAAPALKFKIARRVTLPLLKPSIDKPFYVRIDSVIFVGKELKGDKGADGKPKKEPAHLMHVTDLETGEPMQLIVNTVLQGIMADEYPENSYVGRAFEMIKQAKATGKEYHPFTVTEIELE